jgi:hypothetical protein
LLTTVRDCCLFLYGGIDMQAETLFEDGYLWADGEWHHLAMRHNLSPRVKVSTATCNHRLYAFGGEGPSPDNSLLFNDLHEILVDPHALEACFREVTVKGTRPRGRTSHCLASLSERLLLVYGGEGAEKGAQVVLSDLWVFDLHELLWAEVECAEGRMPPRFDFGATSHRQELYLFGGFDQDNAICNTLTRLEYTPPSSTPLALCQRCLGEDGKPHSLAGERAVDLSVGFLHSLALDIGFPFRAIDLIVDVASALGASMFNISSLKSRSDYDMLTLGFDAPGLLPLPCFLEGALSASCEPHCELLHLLTLGALRLGKTFLYVSADGHSRRVMLASADSKFVPGFEESPARLSYVEGLGQGEGMAGETVAVKQAVYDVLLTQLVEPFEVLSLRQGHLLLVIQLNVLPTVEKAFYYELVSYSRPEQDLKIYFNEKKNELLEGAGLSLTHSPEFSLHEYLQISRLHRGLALTIEKGPALPRRNYLDQLRGYEGQGLVQALDCHLSQHPLVR